MAIDSVSDKIREKGVGAATILHVALPEIDRQIDGLLVKLDQCDADLCKFLDIRAELRVLRRFKSGLLDKIRNAGLDTTQLR